MVDYIKDLVAMDKVEKALEYLGVYAKGSDLYNEVILLSNQYRSNYNSKMMNIEVGESARVYGNKINNAILSLLDRLEDDLLAKKYELTARDERTIRIELTIQGGGFNDFTKEKQNEILERLSQLLDMGIEEIKLRFGDIRQGSITIPIDLPGDKAELLLKILKELEIDEFSVRKIFEKENHTLNIWDNTHLEKADLRVPQPEEQKVLIDVPFSGYKGNDFNHVPNKGYYLNYFDLRGSNLRKANLQGANLEGANLEGANLEGANLERAILKNANLENSVLVNANLKRANLENANLKNINGRESRWLVANLKKANFSGANLEDMEMLGVKGAGAIFRGASLCGGDILGANLEEADFSHADLRWVNMQEVNFQGANLCGALIKGANLKGADLTGAKAFALQWEDFLEAGTDVDHINWI